MKLIFLFLTIKLIRISLLCIYENTFSYFQWHPSWCLVDILSWSNQGFIFKGSNWVHCYKPLSSSMWTPVRAQYVRFVRIGLKFSFLTKKWVAQPNTYEWLWLSKSYRYWSSSLWTFISSVMTTRPMAISSKGNSTHGNFVQGQLDPRQFRPRTTRPTVISSKDNSTHDNFVQGQIDQR